MNPVTADVFFEQLAQEFRKKLPADPVDNLLRFSQKVFDLYPLRDLQKERLADTAGFLSSFYGFMGDFNRNGPKIRVFNPNIEEHGWEHRHTQVFILDTDMPFMTDSVLMALNKHHYTVHNVQSALFKTIRDDAGHLINWQESGSTNSVNEVLMFFQIDHFSSIEQQAELEHELAQLLSDVQAVTDDFHPCIAKLDDIIAQLQRNAAGCPDAILDETLAFLKWMKDQHFTFLGYAYFDLIPGIEPVLHHDPSSQLGLFRHNPKDLPDKKLSELVPGFIDFYQGDQLLVMTKSSHRSHIHRDAYCDYIVIKKFNNDGQVVGEHRFLGLYTSRVYTRSPFTIPIIREKLQLVYARSKLEPTGHDGKNLQQIMETYPRDELFHGTADQLFEILIGVWQIKDRKQVRLFARPDGFEKFVSCVVYIPRESYHTDIRLKTEALLMDALDASASQFSTYFGESSLARTHFVFHIKSDKYKQVDWPYLEEKITQFARNWVDDLENAIIDHWGEESGLRISNHFKIAFPVSYQEHFDPRTAVHDIQLSQGLETEKQIAMSFYQPHGVPVNTLKFKVFHLHYALELSELVPILENLGFTVLGEHPYEIKPATGSSLWIQEFTLALSLQVNIDVPVIRQNFMDAFEAVWLKMVDNDAFNHLIVGARLDWQSVALLRLYARYMKQLGLTLSQGFIASTLANYAEITRNLVALFKSNFDPKLAGSDGKRAERTARLEQKIRKSLDDITNLNEDQVLSSYLQLVCATLRTSFFQQGKEGLLKPYIAVKIASKKLNIVPDPKPEYEFFVYSPRFEAVHLRTGKVARGGLRWSDRVEDYRTEVLGLVKAQQVKNAIIVPTGAKGGFVAKKMPANPTADQFQEEGIACYKMFIAAMLDLTDNRISGEIQPPDNVVRRDSDDSYLVVAADKGTARFSDIANQVSSQYHYWLGDAFASGGSNGYDHKAMGITARGGWVAVRQHFLEQGLDIQSEDFTVIGIGDMSGDVFGNGLLLSRHIKLVAAFNHEAIFLDPNPDMDMSYAERQRLFNLPRSRWSDYNSACISKGGGVFSRQVKAIPLSPEAQQMLQVSESTMKPSQLIKTMLCSQVDLIWNGGIGTYIKSHSESHVDVGDRVNEELRVNGNQLQCKVFGEGGNLGMTQLGRIEFALNGGACNTDFIDNAGGVSCSDIEVNTKILLDQLVESQDMTVKQRNSLLEDMTDAVADIVLDRNYRQVQGLSLAVVQSRSNISQFWHCLQDWEQAGLVNRSLEYLPTDEQINERALTEFPLTRPELAVLVSHAKIMIKDAFIKTPSVDDPYIGRILLKAFPRILAERYPEPLSSHILRREIIANEIANEIVDLMGLSFIHRQMKSTGADWGEIVCAYVIARDVLKLDVCWSEIEDHPTMSAPQKLEFLAILMGLGGQTTRWVLRNRGSCNNIKAEVDTFVPFIQKQVLAAARGSEDDLPLEEQQLKRRCQSFNLSEYTTYLLMFSEHLVFNMGMVDVIIRTAKPVETVAAICLAVENTLSIYWFAEQIQSLNVSSRWEDYAKEAFMDELEHQFRSLVFTLIEDIASPDQVAPQLDRWKQSQSALIERWTGLIKEVHALQTQDFAMFSVVLRELLILVNNTTRSDKLSSICSIGDSPGEVPRS